MGSIVIQNTTVWWKSKKIWAVGSWLCLCVCVFLYICVSVYVLVYVCMSVCLLFCICVYVCVCLYVSVYVCMCVFLYVCGGGVCVADSKDNTIQENLCVSVYVLCVWVGRLILNPGEMAGADRVLTVTSKVSRGSLRVGG